MNLEYGKNNIEEVPLAQYMEQFRSLDPEAAAARCGIPYDPVSRCFTVHLLQTAYTVSWPEFEVHRLDGDSRKYAALEASADAKIFVIRFLLHGVPAESTGKFLTYRELPNGELYFKQFQGRCLMRLAYGFGSRLEQFCAAMEKLGAQRLSSGDASYEMEFIDHYRVQYILWAGDEEFPSSAQILFSDNFPLSFETYDLAVVGDISITTLKKI